MPESSNFTTSQADLLELARLVEQDGITSDILPAYIQALLTVRLLEPDYLCRKAASRFVHRTPPLAAGELADALRTMADQNRPPKPVVSNESLPTSPSWSQALKAVLAHIRRLVPSRNH